MSLTDSLDDFRADIVQANGFISMAYEQDVNDDYLYDSIKQEFIVSSAFLRMFIAWEKFIQDAFAKYLIGEISTQGTPVDTFVTPIDLSHANSILIGTNRYVDWANHEIVLRLAKLYLKDGEPIASNIASVSSVLADLKTIRNAAAHISTSTQTLLDSLASRILGRQMSNMTVSSVVMVLHPEDTNRTVLQYYQDVLDVVAENVAANRT